uniref:Uncharacterized protein n=1 Tax=Trypanosoma congolense (strain IL3000) TaxID=1068625 RepID=G0UPF6_TRYCI|nr:conserved hypothetical protein [Trypanosoma congolense IL3000]
MSAVGSILALLRLRLPIAPLLPTVAAKLLGELYPCEDHRVTAHLVGRIDGNGLLLPLPTVLELIQIGYSNPLSRGNSSALSQWSPMEETLFIALLVRLKRTKWRFDSCWEENEPSGGSSLCELHRPLSRAREANNVSSLEKLMLLMVSVGKFVHHSTLTKRARRLQLLADALSPVATAIGSSWDCVSVTETHGTASDEYFQKIGSLATTCLRLYGKFFTSQHRIFCSILLTGADASLRQFELSPPSTGTESVVGAQATCDIFMEANKIFTCLLVRACSDAERYTAALERWLDLTLRFSEVVALRAASMLPKECWPHCYNTSGMSSSSALGVGCLNFYTTVMHMVVVLVAMYAYRCQLGGFPHTQLLSSTVMSRGLKVTLALLDVVVAFSMTSKEDGKANAADTVCHLTCVEWFRCCDAIQVSRIFASHYLKSHCLLNPSDSDVDPCPRTLARNTLDVRMLHDASKRLAQFVSRDEGGECPSLPFFFFFQLVRVLHSWSDACDAFGELSLCTLWTTLCAVLPRQLHECSPPLLAVLKFLQCLCCSASPWPQGQRLQLSKGISTMATAALQMCDNCLTYLHGRFLCGSVEADTDVMYRIFHTLAALSARKQQHFAAFRWSLFAHHPSLMHTLKEQLIPMERGMTQFFGDPATWPGGIYVREVEHDSSEALCGGAHWVLCAYCNESVLWPGAGPGVGSAGLCSCGLRSSEPVESVAAYVELFLPFYQHCEVSMDDGYFQGSPFPVLRALYNTALRSRADGVPITTADGASNFLTTYGLLPFRCGGGCELPTSAAAELITSCHCYLLRVDSSIILPRFVHRILRIMFTASPALFVCTYEFVCFLFHRLVPREGSGGASSCGLEGCDLRELWEILLCACAARVARAGRCLQRDFFHGDEDNLLSRVQHVSDDEDSEFVHCVLRNANVTGDGEDSIFIFLQNYVLKRAMEFL